MRRKWTGRDEEGSRAARVGATPYLVEGKTKKADITESLILLL